MESLSKKEFTLDTKRLTLKILLPEDVTLSYVHGINDPEVNKYLLMKDKGDQTIEPIKSYVSSNLDCTDALLFGIFVKPDNELIGTIRLSGISPFHYCCDIGICIFSKKYWKKGLARDALGRIIEFAFDYLGLHYIEAGVFSENTSSLDLFLKSGLKIRNSYSDKLRLKDRFAEVTILYMINPRFDFKKLQTVASSNS
jgi:RimJ/RimL family protein N-acetyltransferase